jgi:hypothetical protein
MDGLIVYKLQKMAAHGKIRGANPQVRDDSNSELLVRPFFYHDPSNSVNATKPVPEGVRRSSLMERENEKPVRALSGTFYNSDPDNFPL